MIIRRRKTNYVIYCILLLLFISQYLTLIFPIIFGNISSYNMHFFIALTMAFGIFFFTSQRSQDGPLHFKMRFGNLYLGPFFILLVLELIRIAFFSKVNDMDILLVFLYLTSPFLLFYLTYTYLLTLNDVNPYRIFLQIIKPYVLLCNLIVLMALFIYCLFLIGVISPYDYPMKDNLTFWTNNNTETLGSSYLFPWNMVVIIDAVRIPFLNSFGVFCGLSHEPHIATLFITPAFFLSRYLYKGTKLIVILFSYIFFMLIATSTINLLIFPPLLLFYFLIKNRNNKSGSLKAILIVILICTASLYAASSLFEDLKSFLLLKTSSASGSLDYSENMLNYIVEPSTLFGYGVWKIPYPYANINDIGFIGMLSMFAILGLFLFYIIRNMKNKEFYTVGFAGLYFVLHSFKIPQLTLIYPFTYYILFLLIFCSKINKKRHLDL